MAKPPKWQGTLRAAQDEAALAAKLYNDPSQSRSFEAFVVHMHLAWLYLLHAEFIRDGIDYRYWSRTNRRRLERVDGEVKRWELAKCVKHRWPNESGLNRLNTEFFIALRNKIEHRHSQFDEYLAIAVAGKAQALLLNFEKEMTAAFGEIYSMANVLRFPVFVGTFTEDGTRALKELQDRLPRDLQRFIADFHSGLPEGAENDPAFELRLKVVMERTPRDPDALTIKFINWDDMTEEERTIVQRLGRDGRAVIRDRTVYVSGANLVRPNEVVGQVAARIPFVFNMHHATQAWKTQRIRPESRSAHPERTDERYCIYDSLANTYGYTRACIERVIRHCQTGEKFQEFTGCEAKRLVRDEGSRDLLTQANDQHFNQPAACDSPPSSDSAQAETPDLINQSTNSIVEQSGQADPLPTGL